MGKEDQVPGLNRQLSSKLFGLLQLTNKSQRTIILERLRVAKTASKQNFHVIAALVQYRGLFYVD